MKTIFIIVIICFSFVVRGQDLQLTQFYASPLYLNPALAGSNSYTRIVTSYRNQWAGLPGSFNSFLLSFDHYFQRLSSGVGALITKDRAGTVGLGTNSIELNYAFDYKINRYWSTAIGISAAYRYRTLDFDKLIFGDQIVRNASSSVQPQIPEKVHFFDFSSGLVFFSAKTWFGISFSHITKPDQSFLPKGADLPVKGSIHGGTNIYLEKKGSGKFSIKPYFMLAANYKFQEKYDQLDVGLYLKQPSYFVGVWYRGIPVKHYKPGYSNHDAFAVLLGGMYKHTTLSYSYDFTVSRLAGVSGGSHEIAITYYIPNPKKLKKVRKKIIPCPDIL
jgi:type IX secretion system PorP/SprF family membrane protein